MENDDFKREVCTIINPQRDILYFSSGNFSSCSWPSETILDLHKKSPGSIFALCHTHPPKSPDMSSIDEGTLKRWTMTLYPFPMRMIIITEIEKLIHPNYTNNKKFLISVWLSTLESLDEWEERGKKDFRIITIRKTGWREMAINFNFSESEILDIDSAFITTITTMVKESYRNDLDK